MDFHYHPAVTRCPTPNVKSGSHKIVKQSLTVTDRCRRVSNFYVNTNTVRTKITLDCLWLIGDRWEKLNLVQISRSHAECRGQSARLDDDSDFMWTLPATITTVCRKNYSSQYSAAETKWTVEYQLNSNWWNQWRIPYWYVLYSEVQMSIWRKTKRWKGSEREDRCMQRVRIPVDSCIKRYNIQNFRFLIRLLSTFPRCCFL